MELTRRQDLETLLARHGFHFSKGLGQNFIINPTVCPRIIEGAQIDDRTAVLEIGPGIGTLTTLLAERAGKVVAVELDHRLFPILAETLADYNNIFIIQGDVLKIKLADLWAEYFAGYPVKVCANLPYNITSPILMGLLESRLPMESITVMVQKEAAQRLCARVGSREAGAVTVAVHYYTEPKLLFPVSSGSFLPAPKVDSAVIQLRLRDKPPLDLRDEKRFFRLVKAGFAQRRKTLYNILRHGMGLSDTAAQSALERAQIPANTRLEALSMEALGTLANALTED